MKIVISPGHLNGNIAAIPSKSQAHRLLICAAFADRPTNLICPQTNRDIMATVSCLNALGAEITQNEEGYCIKPIQKIPTEAVLNCDESGSTLRFLLPVAGALGVSTTFKMSGRLPKRPLSPLWEEMERMGCTLCRPTENTIQCTGILQSGIYTIAGNISSQFISGLLFAMAIMSGTSKLIITNHIESTPYISMTEKALNLFGVDTKEYTLSGRLPLTSPGNICVEGDWSNASFFLAAASLGNTITVTGLDQDSAQGDRAIIETLSKLTKKCSISAADIPDLVPILTVVAAAKNGAQFNDIQRLRLKESDRVQAVIGMLRSLGIQAEATTDTLIVYPGKIHGGIVDSCNDHRIAMSAAIAATIANGQVTIENAQCVEKSYPSFWKEYRRLGGNYEQYIW